jgi:tetratricopeptide (TPR) repeat protein
MSTDWLSGAVSGGAWNALIKTSSRRTSAAHSAMNAGAAFLQKQQYDLAIRAFQQALAYDPDSADASYLMARTYTYMGRTEDAIASYRKALRADATHTRARYELGTLYMKSGRYTEAEKEFRQLLATEPTAVDAVISIGYLYMETGRLEEAAVQFDRAARMAPKSAAAHHGMGLVRTRQGDVSSAIEEFRRAIDLDRGYALARSELAFAYLAQGRTDLAREQSDALANLNTAESVALAQQLELAMFTPKISYLDVTHSSFQIYGLTSTPLADIDDTLATPGASVMVTVSFVFNQAMDVTSVQNAFNWSITRASGGQAGVYNHGANLHPEKEAYVPPLPAAVTYDPLTQRATLYFRLTQNETGDAVIDPTHLVFQFRGTDAGGKPMDPAGDQFAGSTMRRF